MVFRLGLSHDYRLSIKSVGEEWTFRDEHPPRNGPASLIECLADTSSQSEPSCTCDMGCSKLSQFRSCLSVNVPSPPPLGFLIKPSFNFHFHKDIQSRLDDNKVLLCAKKWAVPDQA
ncbi:hypothetical protein V6Z88_006661 [Aspergillus fumigatus]